jgi:hypothetical protein
MRPSRFADLFHHLRRCGGHLLHPTLRIIGHQPLLPTLLKTAPPSLHGAQGNPKLEHDLLWVGLPLPATKKSVCEWEQEWRWA